MRRILLFGLICLLLAACGPSAPSGDSFATLAPEATPVMHTPAPTPEPEPTPLEQAFQYARERLRTLPTADDPKAVFPHSSRELLGAADLRDATPRQLEWAWREIAARAGAEPFRYHLFDDRAWFEPNPDFVKEDFSQVEAMNIINLRNTALENFSNIKAVRNNRAGADIDGDGRNESFSLTVDRFSSTAALQIANLRYTIDLPQIDNKVYLCKIDKALPSSQLCIPFVRPGGDYRLAFFSWTSEGGLVMLGELQGDRETVRVYGDGTIAAYALETALCPWRYRLIYQLQGDTLRPQSIGLRPMNLSVTLQTTLALEAEDGASFSVEPGRPLTLVSMTPLGEVIAYDPRSDREGMFRIEEGNLVNGQAPADVFDGLPALG